MSNNKKQTAVEWLQEQLNPDMRTMQGISVQSLLEDAKAMEKEQIMDAVNDSWNMVKHSNFADAQAKQYYNETYGGEQ
jgi:hypothetical protein